MPSTRSIRERDEPLPSLLQQWRTPTASRATATRSASYQLALPATASKPTATERDHLGPTRSRRSSTTAPNRPPAPAAADSDSDSSASSLEDLAKRLSTARQAKSKSYRGDTDDPRRTAAPKETTGEAPKASAFVGAESWNDRQSGTLTPNSWSSRGSRPRSPSTDRAPADFDTVPSGPEQFEATTAADFEPKGDEAGLEGSDDGDNDDDDGANTSAAYVVSHAEGHPDPRDLLRAQLARPAPTRSSSRPSIHSTRTDSHTGSIPGVQSSRSHTSRPTAENAADPTLLDAESEALLYLPRRYFVLSTAGKLVYTSDPNEEAATGLVGVMQAIVSIFADEGDKIRYIDAGQTRISFLLKAPLYLVVVSSQGEPEPVLRQHLEYLYLQVLSVVTLAQLQSIFAKRSNFDLGQLIAGTEPFFDSLTSSLQTSFAIFLSSISVYRLAPILRSQLARALDPGKEAIRDLDLLYVLLLAGGRLVTLLRPKKHSIHPTDLHLLLSTVYAPRRRGGSSAGSSSTREAQQEEADDDDDAAKQQQQQQQRSSESKPNEDEDEKKRRRAPRRRVRPSPLVEPGAEAWLPICLPRFNSRGFLHAYVSFLETGTGPSSGSKEPADLIGCGDDDEGGGGGIGLVILSSRRDAFAGVHSAAQAIKARLLSSPTTATTPSSSSTRVPTASSTSPTTAAADGGLVHSILMARAHQSYSLGEVAVPGLRHFVYKDRERVQVTMPRWEGEYDVGEHGEEAERARMRLMTLYQRLHHSLHPPGSGASSSSTTTGSPSVQYLRTSREAVLGWVTTDFELYVSTSPLLPHAAVVSCARSVSKWVKQDAARLFLSGRGAGVF